MSISPEVLADLKARKQTVDAEFVAAGIMLNDMYAKDGAFSDEEQQAYNTGQLRHGQLEREQRSLAGQIGSIEPLIAKPGAKRGERTAFARWMLNGSSGLTPDERASCLSEVQDEAIPGGGGETFLIRGESTRSDDVSGQELVPETVRPSVIERLKFYGGVGKMAYQFSTSNGNEHRLPANDDASVEGTILAAQEAAVGEKKLADFTQITFGAHTATSKKIPITREMLQDSIIDVQAYAEMKAVRRLGRRWERAFTEGTGVNEPTGVINTAKVGAVSAVAGAITWAETVDLPYKLDRAYRMGSGEDGMGGLTPEGGGRVGYMISDDCERILRRLVDGDSRPLWVPSTREGVPSMLNGYPYEVNGNMAAVAGGSVSMLFGNFSYYGIRTVNTVEIFRFMDSGTMENNLVECLAFSRRDAKPIGLLDGGKCEAYVKLTQKA